jgi:hypothetical protein
MFGKKKFCWETVSAKGAAHVSLGQRRKLSGLKARFNGS